MKLINPWSGIIHCCRAGYPQRGHIINRKLAVINIGGDVLTGLKVDLAVASARLSASGISGGRRMGVFYEALT